jgi:hypothetical protein
MGFHKDRQLKPTVIKDEKGIEHKVMIQIEGKAPSLESVTAEQLGIQIGPVFESSDGKRFRFVEATSFSGQNRKTGGRTVNCTVATLREVTVTRKDSKTGVEIPEVTLVLNGMDDRPPLDAKTQAARTKAKTAAGKAVPIKAPPK